jgi:hypothetical protein
MQRSTLSPRAVGNRDHSVADRGVRHTTCLWAVAQTVPVKIRINRRTRTRSRRDELLPPPQTPFHHFKRRPDHGNTRATHDRVDGTG